MTTYGWFLVRGHAFVGILSILGSPLAARAQEPPYDTRPEIAAPYHRVRYDAGTEAGAGA